MIRGGWIRIDVSLQLKDIWLSVCVADLNRRRKSPSVRRDAARRFRVDSAGECEAQQQLSFQKINSNQNDSLHIT